MVARGDDIRTVALVSLGCPKNLVDSERMLGLLAQHGLIIAADPRDADAIVINTCGFLQAAREESLEEIRKAIDLKTTGRCRRVIVAGCLTQRERLRLLEEVPGIDRLVGVFDRENIVRAVCGLPDEREAHGQYLGRYHQMSPAQYDDRARLRLTPRHYAYLRICDGCSRGCSFCTIPAIRGPLRSKPIEQIIAEADELAADGAVELNLIGQDTTSYGSDIGYAPGLAGLLRTLDRRLPAGVRWIRLMYAYPRGFTDEMIDAIASCGRVVKYIDLPLQHISDAMLARMNRRVTRRQIETLLEKLRRRVPGIVIRTTFICGAAGETEEDHQQLLRFVRDFRFDMMGVFVYSREPGTRMARMSGHLPDDVKKRRAEALMLAQREIAFDAARRMVGRTIQVLVDGRDTRDAARFTARSAGQAPEIDSVVLVRAQGLRPGQFIEARVIDAEGYDLVAEPALAHAGASGPRARRP